MPDGEKRKIRGMTWDVSHAMKRCVAKYETAVKSITGKFPRICNANTPFVPSETKVSRCRAPNTNEDYFECPTCCDSFPASLMHEKFHFKKGTVRPIRKILPIIKKKECTPNIDEESELWAHVAAGGVSTSETDSDESDEDDVGVLSLL